MIVLWFQTFFVHLQLNVESVRKWRIPSAKIEESCGESTNVEFKLKPIVI